MASSPASMSPEIRHVLVIMHRVIPHCVVLAFRRGVYDVLRTVGESGVGYPVFLGIERLELPSG